MRVHCRVIDYNQAGNLKNAREVHREARGAGECFSHFFVHFSRQCTTSKFFISFIVGVIVDSVDYLMRSICLPCVKNCYFPHAGDVSTEYLRSSSVSLGFKCHKGRNGFFYRFHYLARATIANVTKRLLRKIESR